MSRPVGNTGQNWIETGKSGRAGLAASGLSVALTFTVAGLGPSLMEPALPGRPGQPPWSIPAHPSPYLVIGLTVAAIAAGTTGLALTIRAGRRGWQVSPALLLAAGITAAVALALVPPFGSSDHLSYAAYGRMAVTGHDPYTTTPAALARLGDPIARAVQDWRSSPSVYGSLATAAQALASAIGGTSVRLTVFVLSLLDVVAFALTGLLLHWLARGDRRRQLRAALLWTTNPLLLQVLVAGAHVDSQALFFGVAAIAAFSLSRPVGAGPAGPGPAGSRRASWEGRTRRPGRQQMPAHDVRVEAGGLGRSSLAAVAAGALVGLGFAVKATMALVGIGLVLAVLLPGLARRRAGLSRDAGGRTAILGGLAVGFAATAGASLAFWGVTSLRPALRAGSYVSIGSPWRPVRSALALVMSAATAEDVVKLAAVVLAIALLLLMLRSIAASGSASLGSADPGPVGLGPAGLGPAGLDSASPGSGGLGSDGLGSGGVAAVGLAGSVVVAIALAWLFAWPYVLPWYDGLGWALLVLLPWSRLDWLLLARTTALALGYLPARGEVRIPAGLGWLEPVVRTAVTPVILLVGTMVLVVTLWPGRGWTWPGEDEWGGAIPFRPKTGDPDLEVRS